MNKFIYILIIVLLSISKSVFCQVKQIKIEGIYEYIGNIRDSAYLELKTDSTFNYYWKWKQLSGTTSGKWEIIKKFLYLNSEKQPSVKTNKIKDWYTVKAINDSLTNKVTIHFKDVNGTPLKFAECWVISKDKLFSKTSDSNGNVNFDIGFVKHISVVAPFAQKGFITYKDNYKQNYFEITLLNVNQKYLYLTSEKFRINKKEDEIFLYETIYDPRANDKFRKIK